MLLGRSADWLPWLRPAVLIVGAAVAVALLGLPRLPRRVALVLAGAAVLVGLAGPAAYAVQTAATPHTGSIPSAGPATTGGPGGPGRTGRRFGPPAGQARGGPPGQVPGTAPNGVTPPTGGLPTGGPGNGTARTGGPQGGGLLTGSTPSAALVAALRDDAGSYTWAAAAVGSNSAAGYQLASGAPVMAVGGFNGSDPSPTLAQFQQYVAAGRIHYFLGGGGMTSNGGSNASSRIAAWVAETFTATTISGATVYDLTATAG